MTGERCVIKVDPFLLLCKTKWHHSTSKGSRTVCSLLYRCSHSRCVYGFSINCCCEIQYMPPLMTQTPGAIKLACFPFLNTLVKPSHHIEHTGSPCSLLSPPYLAASPSVASHPTPPFPSSIFPRPIKSVTAFGSPHHKTGTERWRDGETDWN